MEGPNTVIGEVVERSMDEVKLHVCVFVVGGLEFLDQGRV
jgi:hypothetical protein